MMTDGVDLNNKTNLTDVINYARGKELPSTPLVGEPGTRPSSIRADKA